MADLYFRILADTKELDEAYKKMERMDKLSDEITQRLKSSDPGSKEFKELNKQLSALEKQYDAAIKKVAELEGKLASATGSTAKTVTSSTSTEVQAYESVITAIRDVLGTRNENLALLAKEEIAIKQIASERRTLEQLEKNNAISTQEAIRQREKLISRELEHKQAASELRMILGAETKELQAADTSMKQMAQTLGRMREAYRQMTDQERNSPFGQQLQKDIQDLNQKMIALDAGIGNHQRNVGNYASSWNGLSFQVQQVAREMPSMAVGMSTFILAISNNLPMLADELKKASAEYKAFQAAVKSGATDIPKVAPVWKQLASSIFSWQTALVVGITLLTVYWKDIANFTKGLFGANQAQQSLNDSMTDFNSILAKETLNLRAVFSAIDRTKEGTEGRKKAIDAINTAFGKYLPNLLSEKSSLMEINAAYKLVNKSIRENAAAKAQSNAISEVMEKAIKVQSEALTEMRETAAEKLGESKSGSIMDIVTGLTEDFRSAGQSWEKAWQGVSAKIQSELGDKKLSSSFFSELEDYVRSVYKSEKQISDIQKQFNPFFNKEEADKAIIKNKEYFESIKQQALSVLESIAPEQIKLLDDGKMDGIDSVIVEKYKAAKASIDEATEALKAYESYEKKANAAAKANKEANKLLKTKQEQADLLLEISRNAKERENAERQTAFEIEQVKIDIMKDGFVKEQAQIDLNHRKALQGITLRGEEMLKAQQEAERKQWEKDGKKGVFTPKTTSVSQLPTEQLQQLSGLMNGVVAKTNSDNQTLIDSMVKQYQTYAEKRKEIEKKFDDDIRSMQEKNTDGKYDANIKEAGKQRTEALAEIDSTVVANKNMWTRLFADTSAMSKKQIKQILSDIKNLTDYLEGLDVTIPVGFTQEQLDQLKKDPEKIKAIYDELIKKQDELDDRTNYPFSGIIKGFGKLKEAAELAEKATKATTEEEKKILEYQAESAKAKGMDYIREGAVMASDSVSMLADKLKELAAATGDERFSESAEQFGALAQNLGAAAKGFQSGGWIGAIIGGATDMLTQTFQAITTAKAEVKEFEDNRKDFLTEYNLLLLKNRISSEDQDNVFGTSALKRASEAAKAAQDALAQYTDEVTKRTAPEIKKEFKNLGAAIFGMNPFTSLNFLGFGKKISNETKTLQAAFEKGYTDLQAMAVKTKDRSGWANFWGKKDEYTSLKDLAPKLWNEETGDFDIEAAKVFLDTNTQISDEQRKQIQNVIDLKESYNDAMQVLKDDVSDTFGSLGTGLMDSIVGAIQNGDIAMEKFADSVGKTFENLGKKIAQELFFQKEFDKLQEDLVKTYDMGDSEAIANAQMDIVSRFFDSIGGKMDEAEAWMEEWKKKAAEKGFTLWGEGESDWLGTTTDSIAQSILDGLEAGKSGIADFADDFESLMKKAVLNSIKMKYLEEPLKEFYKKFASFSESGGQLTEAEIEELRGMYGDIVSGAKAQFDSLKDIAGLDFTADSDNSLKGAFAKASQESIDLLAGQFGAMRVDTTMIKDNTAIIRELQAQGWQDVRAIKDLTVKIDRNSERVAENTRMIYDIAGEISRDTRRSADVLDGGTINAKVKM